MKAYLLIFLGGGIGASMRFWLSGVVYTFLSTDFPYGNAVVNISGSFFIGLLMSVAEERFMVDRLLRTFLAIGVLGGFTTFSSFSYETVSLLRDGQYFFSSVNILVTLVGCLGATVGGILVGKLL
ncbi:MAG: fluoride efflux transporter CrcB [Ignavibacteriales bacterium]|nr:fluoride efflux transporter CrcB [Ignavibacteriales bacterium]